MRASGTDSPETQRGSSLYFFPDAPVTAEQLTRLLREGSRERRAWAVSHLLRYADWEDIWTYVERDDVRELFPDLDLPEGLRAAWARMLRIETVPAP
ncbi:MAG: hypothetical protein R2862_06925 [Thermoanaerobaculia bacterium]